MKHDYCYFERRDKNHYTEHSTLGVAEVAASGGEPTRIMPRLTYLERRLELGRGVHGCAQQAEARGDRLCPCEHGSGQAHSNMRSKRHASQSSCGTAEWGAGFTAWRREEACVAVCTRVQ